MRRGVSRGCQKLCVAWRRGVCEEMRVAGRRGTCKEGCVKQRAGACEEMCVTGRHGACTKMKVAGRRGACEEMFFNSYLYRNRPSANREVGVFWNHRWHLAESVSDVRLSACCLFG